MEAVKKQKNRTDLFLAEILAVCSQPWHVNIASIFLVDFITSFRGNGGQDVFLTDADRYRFYQLSNIEA